MASVEETSDQFEKKIYGHMMSSYITIGVAYGHRLGLFEVLAKVDSPKTVLEISSAAELKERYVQEWLGLMVMGDIIDTDSTGTTFYLPAHRRRCLTEEGGVDNMGIMAAWIPTFMKGFEYVIDASKPEGPAGFPQENFSLEFYVWMDSFTKPLMSQFLLTSIVPLIPGFKEELESGTSVLSSGCGSGIDSVMLADAFRRSNFCGIDVDPLAITRARKSSDDKDLKNVQFEVQDAAKLPPEWSNKYDYATSIYSVHDCGRPDLVLKEIYRVLKPGGFYLMIEFKSTTNVNDNKGKPVIEFLYCASLLHCVPTSLSQKDGMGLGVCWGEETMCKMMKDAGFETVEIKPFPGVDYLVGILGKK